jgi:hypothetical protein
MFLLSFQKNISNVLQITNTVILKFYGAILSYLFPVTPF